MKSDQLEVIHESLVNGQREQMVRQIDEYGLYDFWAEYRDWLRGLYSNVASAYVYYTDATVSYFRIKDDTGRRAKG